VIDEQVVSGALEGVPVQLLNDLEALAHAVPFLEPSDIHTLYKGEPDPNGNIAVVAPGTGLGETFLTRMGSRYRVHASEGGHADFAPTDPVQLEMLRYLHERFGHVSFERVGSGRGLPNIYAYLKESGYADEPAWLAERLASAEDPTPVIVEAALDEGSPCALCTATLDTFVSILGAEAGNLALKVLATGGVYLGGGIPPRILPALKGERFLQSFRSKGRISDVLERIPVHVIVAPDVPLMGAARHVMSAVGTEPN